MILLQFQLTISAQPVAHLAAAPAAASSNPNLAGIALVKAHFSIQIY